MIFESVYLFCYVYESVISCHYIMIHPSSDVLMIRFDTHFPEYEGRTQAKKGLVSDTDGSYRVDFCEKIDSRKM